MNNNYIPLYRKYRPQTLETLIGQEHVKKTLSTAIELGKVSHAYLFTGPRGTGKTSTARILAKSLNCKNGPTVHPCGECESCRDITNSVPIDVIEIDAASNRKVEDAQNLLEKIQYAPVYGKYKIYIIDEVHMLSNTAFNALLKTLEEPPENVIFILATTEVHKVLDTIKSRCQRFDFKRITTEDIIKHLRYISDKENINISDDALAVIAKNSAGGMRDSISLLDQLSIVGMTQQITAEDVNSILGRVSFDTLNKIVEKIISSSSTEVVEIIHNVYNSGNEPLQILNNLFEYLKNLLIAKKCAKNLLADLTGLNDLQIDLLLKQKDLLETHQIVFLIERTSFYIKEVKNTTNPYLWLEVGMIDLSNMTENTTLADLQNRVKLLEENSCCQNNNVSAVVTKPVVINTVKAENNENKKNETKEDVSVNSFAPPPMSKKTDGNNITNLWQNILSNIKSPSTCALLKLATPETISSENVVITFKNENLISQINNGGKKQMIIDAANIVFNQNNTNVIIKLSTNNQKILPEKKDDTISNEPENCKSSSVQNVVPPKSESESIVKPEVTAEVINQKEENLKNANPTDQEKMVLDLFDGKYVK